MTDTPKPQPKTSGKWVRIVLFVSLAANLLIVGIVAGAVLRGGPDRPDRAGGPPALFDLGKGPIGRALSQHSRRLIGRELGGRSHDLRANREEVRAQYETLLNALRNTPFDPTIVDNIISDQQIKLLARQDIGKNLLITHVANMTAQQRREYADRLERFLRRGAGHN